MQVARTYRNLCCLHVLWLGTNSTILKPKFWWKQFLQRREAGSVGKGSVRPREGSTSWEPQQRLRLWRQGRRTGRDGRERWRTSESPSCVCEHEGEAGKCRLMPEKWPYSIIKMIHKHSGYFQLSFLYVKGSFFNNPRNCRKITLFCLSGIFMIDQKNTWEGSRLSFWEFVITLSGS